MLVSISPLSPFCQAISALAPMCWHQTRQAGRRPLPPAPSTAPETSCSALSGAAGLVCYERMYSVLMSLPTCPVSGRQTSSTRSCCQTGLATDHLPPASPFPISKQPHQVMPCPSPAVSTASRKNFPQPWLALLLFSPIASADHEPGNRLPSTHVKLQLLPKSIPMASCCAEEMLISSSPPVFWTIVQNFHPRL